MTRILHCPFSSRRFLVACWFCATALAGTSPVLAQGFAAYVSPPRFELHARAGDVIRQVLDIEHAALTPGHYRLYTNDWAFQSDNSVVFSDVLASDSCRPWVTLEKRELTLTARARFRFEIAPPAGTAARECRFALMVEGLDPAQLKQGALQFPVGGRIAVMVYLSVDEAEPVLQVLSSRTLTIEGRTLPVIEVRNTGLAHGRLDGFLEATLPSGEKVDLAPADAPILPGATRLIVLEPQAPSGQITPSLFFPLTVRGQLEWGKHKTAFEQHFLAP